MQLYVFSLDGTNECVFNANNEGRLLYSNSVALEVLGKRPAEILGRSFYDVLFQNPGDAEKASSELAARDKYQGEQAYQTPEGISKVLEVSISRVKKLEEDGIAYATVVRDVTDRSRSEEKFKERFQYLQQREDDLELCPGIES